METPQKKKSKKESVHAHVFLTCTHIKHTEIRNTLYEDAAKSKDESACTSDSKGLGHAAPKRTAFFGLKA